MDTKVLASPSSDAPALFSVLPLVYVAWADGILSPSELHNIKVKLLAQGWIEQDEKNTLAEWLNPKQPPSATTYQRWLATIRHMAEQVPGASRQSLAGLGIEMATMVHPSGTLRWTSPEARLALEDIEDALGLVSSEAIRELLAERPATVPDDKVRPPFDVALMTRWLNQPYPKLRQKLRTLLRDPIFRYPEAPPTEEYRDQVYVWLKLLAEQGYGALAYPEAYGGENNIEKFITVFETLGYHDLSLAIKFGVQFGLFGGSVHQLGTEYHHENYLPAIGRLELPGCFAMTELGHGSNVRELETIARFDPETDTFEIHTPSDNAQKTYIGNAARHGRMATVFAQLETHGQHYGVHAFLVPIREDDGTPWPGVRIADNGEKMGLNGVDNGRLWFDHVRVPRRNLLNRFADVNRDGTYSSPILSEGKRFFTMLGTLVGGRISVALAGLSAAKSGLTIAIRYANRRRQFGPKDQPETQLLDYLTHQRRLLPLLANAYALHVALQDLKRRFAHSRTDDLREIETLASGLKAFGTWNTTHTLQTCREACGGQGYLAENRFAALKADTDVFTTFEGDNTVLLLQVAKALLSDYRHDFQDMKFFGLVRYLSDEAVTVIKELNPIVTRKTDEAHLRDPAFHLAAFRYRERSLLQSAARRLRQRIKDGMDSYQAFIQCQDHLVTLSHAYVERVVLEHFIDAVNRQEDIGARDTLRLLCDLFALYHIEQHRGWYLERGYLEGNKSKAVTRLVNHLLGELRPRAGALVDAFAISDELLAAPIGLKRPSPAQSITRNAMEDPVVGSVS